MQTHAMPSLCVRRVGLVRPGLRRIASRASADDTGDAPLRDLAGSPKRRHPPTRQNRGAGPNTTVPSAGQGVATHKPAPPSNAVTNPGWSSVKTQITHGAGHGFRLSRAELRQGLRARRQRRRFVPPGAVRFGNTREAFTSQTSTSPRVARGVRKSDPHNNVLRVLGDRHRGASERGTGSEDYTEGEDLNDAFDSFGTTTEALVTERNTRNVFGEAFTEMEQMRFPLGDGQRWAGRSIGVETRGDYEDHETSSPSSSLSEFRDASGGSFTVNVTNNGAPPGLTLIELKGVDKANLLGALCSALAKADVSVVSGTIATDVSTNRVSNAIGVYMSSTKQRLDPGVFESLSVRILAACWTADRREWLDSPRSVGRFIMARSTDRELSEFGGEHGELTEAVDATETAVRACSARLADAVERSDDGYGLTTTLDVNLSNLLRDVENAALAASLARTALTVATTPRGMPGFQQTPEWFPPAVSMDDFTYLDLNVNDAMRQNESESFSKSNSEKASVTDSAFAVLTKNPLSLKFTNWYDNISPFVKGVVFMNVASLLFGSNQVVIKQVADAGVDDFTQMFLRFAVATTPLIPFIVKGAKGGNAGEMLRGATHLGTILAVGYFLQIVGLEGTTSAKGALTSTFTVLSVPLFVGASGQKVPWFTWPASICAIIGVGLLTGGDETGFVKGDALCIMSAVIFGYHTLQSSKYAQLFEDQELPFIAFQIGIVAVESGLWKLGELGYHGWVGHVKDVEQGLATSGMSLEGLATATSTALVNISTTAQALPWPALLWMGLATTSFTLWIEFLALRNVSASTCALIYTAEPLWGALFAWHFMGDRWGVPGWIGATLIVGASVGSQLLTFRGDDDKGDDVLIPEVSSVTQSR